MNIFYLVSYEYKEKDGCLVTTKTTTTTLTIDELHTLVRNNNFYEKYLKIVFCQKL